MVFVTAVLLLGSLGVILAGIAIKIQLSRRLAPVVQARHIDSTFSASGCSDDNLGDLNCGASRFAAWNLTASERRDICLSDEEPQSRAFKSVTGWCSSSEPGCNKSSDCEQGHTLHYYLFSVINPEEVMEGVKPEIQEIEPIGIRKIQHKLFVDEGRWNAEGIASWDETYEYSLLYPNQSTLLNKTIIIPNPFMTGRLDKKTPSGHYIEVEHVTYVIAAAHGYILAKAALDISFLDNRVVTPILRKYMPDIVEGNFFQRLYSQGLTLSSSLTALLADFDRCVAFINEMRLPSTGRGPLGFGPAASLGMLLCSPAYLGEASAAVLERINGFTLADSFTFYEFQLGCPEKGDPETGSCRADTICGGDAQCAAPKLTETVTGQLFAFFDQLKAASPDDARDMAVRLLSDCEAGTGFILSPDICEAVGEQLIRVGRVFMYKSKEAGAEVPERSGFEKDDRAIVSIHKRLFPYFLQTTVGQAMGLSDVGVMTPIGDRTFNYSLANPPVHPWRMSQQVSSRYGHEGLGWWVEARNMTHACHYDRRCTMQPTWEANGTCIASLDGCQPNTAAGYDSAMLPAPAFDTGHADHGRIGANFPIFVSDFFLKAQVELTAQNRPWRGARVNLWRLRNIHGRTENCGAAIEGLDCDSPMNTVHVGAFTSPRRGFVPATYASPPHFTNMSSKETDGRRPTYDPADKITILPCKSCPKDRQFATELVTEPELGTALQGVRRLQINTRFTPARISGRLPRGTDLLLPLFWVEQFQTAKEHQVAAIAALQTTRSQYMDLSSQVVVIGTGCLAIAVICSVILCFIRSKRTLDDYPPVVRVVI